MDDEADASLAIGVDENAVFVPPEPVEAILCPGVRLASDSHAPPGDESSSGEEDMSDERFLKQHLQLRWQGFFNNPGDELDPYSVRALNPFRGPTHSLSAVRPSIPLAASSMVISFAFAFTHSLLRRCWRRERCAGASVCRSRRRLAPCQTWARAAATTAGAGAVAAAGGAACGAHPLLLALPFFALTSTRRRPAWRVTALRSLS